MAFLKESSRLLLLLIAGLPLVAAGCSRQSVEIKNVVAAYNKMLPEALSKPDSGVMEFFTTPYERGRIEAYIGFLKSDKRLMVCDLKKLEFLDAAVLPGKTDAVVKTRELWKYYYIDDKTRKRITPDEDLGYENTYRLVRESNHWVVDKVEIHEKEITPGEKR